MGRKRTEKGVYKRGVCTGERRVQERDVYKRGVYTGEGCVQKRRATWKASRKTRGHARQMFHAMVVRVERGSFFSTTFAMYLI